LKACHFIGTVSVVKLYTGLVFHFFQSDVLQSLSI